MVIYITNCGCTIWPCDAVLRRDTSCSGCAMIGFHLKILVVADETGVGLPGLFVKAFDRDLLFDDLLGGALTDIEGQAQIACDEGDFKELFDRRPDVYFKVYSGDRKRFLHQARDVVRWNVRHQESFTIRIPFDELTGINDEPAVDLFAVSEGDGQRVPPAIGDSLMVSAAGLAPMSRR